MRILDALLTAIFVVAAVMLGAIDDIDLKMSDWLYQKPSEKSADIKVIGIDAATLEKLGPFHTWGRREIAKAIDYLNNNNPEYRPAVIGVDVMFSGKNNLNPEYDTALANAVKEYDNVVVASMASVNENQDIEAKNKDPFYPWDYTWPWEAPYEQLISNDNIGHINSPDEKDGIVRHALLYVNVEKRGRLNSFGRVIYEKWCQNKGITPNLPPETKGNGLFYLPFTSDNYDSGFSFLDLIQGQIPPDVYQGKIVLIGPYASGMMDDFSTAIGLMYGIDIHANTIDAFQKGFLPVKVEDTPQLLFLFLFIFCSELLFREGKMLHIISWWLAGCIGWIVFCKICYSAGFIFHVAWVPFFLSILFIGAVMINHYIHVKEENARIFATFGRYFDPAVMEKLMAGNPDVFMLGGKSQNIAVLFVDIRGFTAMSEKISAQSVVEILNSYLTLTAECIHRYHGTIDKFIGDATMAFWNAPLKQDKPILLACQAALDMIDGSTELCKEIKEKFGVNISFGIGIHWGNAVVGNIGTNNRMDYTAIGDTVNTASRLETNAEGGQILISRVVADALGESAEIERLNKNITLKGKEEGFEILVLKSLKEKG